MKDGFRRFEIEPLEDTLDFMGPTQSSDSVKLLEGTVRLSLSRPTKIRSMVVKFKGFGRVSIKGKSNTNVSIFTPMLPKLKCSIVGKSLLPMGDHTIPWSIEIPNIYPPSLLVKRATIFYLVEVVISFALAKSITAEHPITLRRHLLPCVELAPLVETKLYEHTVPAKFHYEIEAPQIICLDQLLVPFAVKYLCIANQKAVQSIRTQLTQIELYRIQSVSKTDANLTQAPMDVYNLEKKVLDCKQRRDYAKFVKRTIPALIHSVDQTRSSAWKQPIVLRHKLHQFLQSTYDSPLVSIHHQLEVTFQFDHRFEDIRAKIPIIIASIPTSSSSNISLLQQPQQQQQQHISLSSDSGADSKYPFETITRFESMSVVPEQNGRPPRCPSGDSHRPHGITHIFGARKSSDGFSDKHRRPMLYNTENSNNSNFNKASALLLSQKGSIKRYNSEYDLNAFTDVVTPPPEDRPRITTPPQRRQKKDANKGNNRRRRRQLPPIDVELANGIKPKPLAKKIDSLLDAAAPRSQVVSNDDHHMSESSSNQDMTRLDNVSNSCGSNDCSSDDDESDFQSVYSDLSLASPEAPSLSSSATGASNGSHHTLFTRPPSPSYRPAPGLPANTALRSHEEQSSALVEESFNYANISSPAIATVASSILLSPCSSNASTATSSTTRRRIALSSVSSIMNGVDTLSFRSLGGPYSHQNRYSNGSGFSQAMIPSSTSSINNSNNRYQARDSDAEPATYNGLSITGTQSEDTAQPMVDAKQHYLHAKLPPIPSDTTTSSAATPIATLSAPTPPVVVIPRIKKKHNHQQDQRLTATEFKVLNETKRMTKLYVDDSDDETLDPLPPIPEKQQAGKKLSTSDSPTTVTTISNGSISNSNIQQWAASLLGASTSVVENVPLPQLPRLSFGMAFGEVLGYDQFNNEIKK
ncbi:hypothetical protein BCR42DRAFT_493347 [Absidia repens]|uniref:Arrestin C-terminal-like domain-containing protein n=1 Tax=Absidia repens TaxID=90262 RepID=A0A1X2IBJ4_9FUNG|nr:hypothetical protein BCR42DRAFT_493347 [Absidia repens]